MLADAAGEQLGPVLTALPSSGRRRGLEAAKAARQDEVAAWVAEHPRSAVLDARFAPVLVEARGLVEDGMWEIWLAPIHPHEMTAAGMVVGTHPDLEAWTIDRYAPLLERLAGQRVVVLGCACPAYTFDATAEAVSA